MTPDDLAAIRARAKEPVLGRSIRRMLDQAILDRRALLAEVERLRAGGPWTTHVETMRAMREQRDGTCICDTNPETTDGPDEECPWHGRPYAEWIARGVALAAKIEQVEALHVRHEFEDSPAVHYCGHCQVTAGLWPCPTVAALGDPKEGA